MVLTGESRKVNFLAEQLECNPQFFGLDDGTAPVLFGMNEEHGLVDVANSIDWRCTDIGAGIRATQWRFLLRLTVMRSSMSQSAATGQSLLLGISSSGSPQTSSVEMSQSRLRLRSCGGQSGRAEAHGAVDNGGLGDQLLIGAITLRIDPWFAITLARE